MRSFYTKIVGVTFANPSGEARQKLIQRMLQEYKRQGLVGLQLQRQLHNAHDCNAVAVLDLQGRQLGFLSRQVARTVAPLIDKGVAVQASAINVTGGDPRFLGVNLKISWPQAA